MNLSDEEIIKIVRERNKDLYADIIRRYELKLSHYLQKFTRNQDELDDILQAVFFKGL
jgi:DNA-directed RNA polymerase specialized sigma24 family protein